MPMKIRGDPLSFFGVKDTAEPKPAWSRICSSGEDRTPFPCTLPFLRIRNTRAGSGGGCETGAVLGKDGGCAEGPAVTRNLGTAAFLVFLRGFLAGMGCPVDFLRAEGLLLTLSLWGLPQTLMAPGAMAWADFRKVFLCETFLFLSLRGRLVVASPRTARRMTSRGCPTGWTGSGSAAAGGASADTSSSVSSRACPKMARS